VTITLGAPQIILLSLELFAIVGAGMLHGRPRTGTYNVFSYLGGAAITIALLAWGGFFS
jgi:hypothetical protein